MLVVRQVELVTKKDILTITNVLQVHLLQIQVCILTAQLPKNVLVVLQQVELVI